MRKYLLIPLAILVVLAGCEKNPPVPDPEPEDPVEPIVIPEPPYTVVESSFSTWRSDGLLVGGVLFSPEELKGKKPALILCHGLDGTWKDTEAYGRAAARMGAAIRPSRPGGDTMAMKEQPAIFAGMAFMNTEEG